MSKEQQNVYVVEVDMKEKSVEDIAREAALQIIRITDTLIERQKQLKGSDIPSIHRMTIDRQVEINMFTAGGSHARLSCRQGTDLWADVVCNLVPFFYALEAF